MPEMKTLNINGVAYEVVDETARNKKSYSVVNTSIPSWNWVDNGDGRVKNVLVVDGVTEDPNQSIHVDVQLSNTDTAADAEALSAFGPEDGTGPASQPCTQGDSINVAWHLRSPGKYSDKFVAFVSATGSNNGTTNPTFIDSYTSFAFCFGGNSVGGTTPELSSVFSDNSWKNIIWACQNNAVPETWAVGDQKSMTIKGIDYAIDIIGKNHDSYSDGSGTAPLTFQLHDCYKYVYPLNSEFTNVGGWKSYDMRTTHLPAILLDMPAEVREGIKEVNKLTSAGGMSSTIETTADKLFILSEAEVVGASNLSNSFDGEGTQYEYYANGGSKIKSTNNTLTFYAQTAPTVNIPIIVEVG